MPVYNGEKYLRDAIESILNQTLRDFEFLIIDDRSTDDSVQIIKSYKDCRINIVHNDSNLTLARTLNKGLVLARGEYIARMDCDDISHPKRLEKQIQYLDKNPDIGICGTWTKVLDHIQWIRRFPQEHAMIKCNLLFDCPMCHPTVVMRKSLIERHNLYYAEEFNNAEDYELWVRAANSILFSNIGEVLLHYRQHPQQICKKNSCNQDNLSRNIRKIQIENLGIDPTIEEVEIHERVRGFDFDYTREFIEKVDIWLCKIRNANAQKNIYSEPELSKVLFQKWYKLCYRAIKRLGGWAMGKFWRSDLTRSALKAPNGFWAIFKKNRY